jgi:GT2 family glycosyltransferase
MTSDKMDQGPSRGMHHPKVSIIILNWNGLYDTIECIESVEKIDYPYYELIVVDNASEGNDVAVLREKFGQLIHIIENDKNYGFAEGCNIGMRYAISGGTDYILLLNNDTTVAPDFLMEMTLVGESDERIGILGPKIYFYDAPNVIWEAGGKINWWLASIKVHSHGEMDNARHDKITIKDFVSGAAMLIKSKLLDTISLLDSSFFFGYEDYDFCIRARRSGFKIVYVPSARIWHKARRTSSIINNYPETRQKIKEGTGIFGAKIRWRLFKKHAIMPPFPIPLILYFLVYWPIRGAQLLILQRFLRLLGIG